ncbi:MAG: transcription termination factor NusA [Candidatus Methylacidiphilales bacterium]
MSQEFLAVLDYMEKEKGINRRTMIEAIEQALLSASRKSFGPANELRVQMNPKTGDIKAFATLRAVEKVRDPYQEISLPKARQADIHARLGSMVEVEVTPKDFGRIAAQVFKQTINQNIRSIEKTMVFDEFKDRVGDLISGTVRRFDRSDVVIDLGKFEGIIPSRERVPTEDYNTGDRIRAVILAVDNTPRGPKIILSRSHPDFIRKLFELEVNELHDGTITIKGLAREAGFRTKIAVWSDDPKIDPVGACVGLRGSRVKNIVRELNNEKIDLFRWSDNVRELIIESLKPAKPKSIEIDEVNKRAKILVDEENLSLAIGRRGQNARLASKLTGWEIDIDKEEIVVVSFEDKIREAVRKLAQSLEIEEALAEQLVTSGFATPEGLAEATIEDLTEALPEADPQTLQQLLDRVKSTS